jgi:hypothetical protein
MDRGATNPTERNDMTTAQVIPIKKGRSVTELIRTAKELYAKAEQAEGKAEQYYISLGLTLAELKEKKPKGITWPVFVRKSFPFGKARADELIRIGSGATTLAAVRAERRRSVANAHAKLTTSSSQREPARNTAAGSAAHVLKQLRKHVDIDEDVPLNQQVNKITRELSGFLADWCASTEQWASEHDQELKREREGKDSLMQFLYAAANQLMQLAQALDGR